jgi:hypothetical protein
MLWNALAMLRIQSQTHTLYQSALPARDWQGDLAMRQLLDIEPITAEELEKIARDLYSSPHAAIERARLMVPLG